MTTVYLHLFMSIGGENKKLKIICLFVWVYS